MIKPYVVGQKFHSKDRLGKELKFSIKSVNPASIIGAGGGDYTTVAAWEADLDDAQFDTDYEAQITGLTAEELWCLF